MTDKDKDFCCVDDWDIDTEIESEPIKRHGMSEAEQIFCAFVSGYENRAGGLRSLSSDERDALGEAAKKYTLEIMGCKPVDFDQLRYLTIEVDED